MSGSINEIDIKPGPKLRLFDVYNNGWCFAILLNTLHVDRFSCSYCSYEVLYSLSFHLGTTIPRNNLSQSLHFL